MIINQISSADREVDVGVLHPANCLEDTGQDLARQDAGDAEQCDPDGQVSLKEADDRFRSVLPRSGDIGGIHGTIRLRMAQFCKMPFSAC